MIILDELNISKSIFWFDLKPCDSDFYVSVMADIKKFSSDSNANILCVVDIGACEEFPLLSQYGLTKGNTVGPYCYLKSYIKGNQLLHRLHLPKNVYRLGFCAWNTEETYLLTNFVLASSQVEIEKNSLLDKCHSDQSDLKSELNESPGGYSSKSIKERVNGIPVITYHHHLPKVMKEESRFSHGSVTNTVESFCEQMEWLFDNGYSTLTLSDFESFLQGSEIPNLNKRVLITFDDGHLSTSRFCYEILNKYSFTAVVFLITSKQPEKAVIDFDPDTLQYISIEEMKDQSDVFEWAAHTHDLHSRSSDLVSNVVSSKPLDVFIDVVKNREILCETKHFCFPFGQYNESVVDVLIAAGFRYFYTTEKGLAAPCVDAKYHLIKRLNVSPWMNISQFEKMLIGS